MSELDLVRGDLHGKALALYVPTRRGGRHRSDAFSRALFLAKKLPGLGAQYAWDQGPRLAALLPEGVTMIATPPSSRARGFYFARELGAAVAQAAGLRLARPLRWAVVGAEASKAIVYQGGKGRALARRVECLELLDGERVCLVDDLATTLITAQLTADALREAGAEVLGVVCLAKTEPTRSRPAAERERLQARAAVAKLRRQAREGQVG